MFREVKKALTSLAPKPSQRRRRTEETKRGFRMAVVVLVRCAVRSFFHHPASVFDIHERAAEAERVLRGQIEEWANDDQAQEQDGVRYAAHSGFDPQP